MTKLHVMRGKTSLLGICCSPHDCGMSFVFGIRSTLCLTASAKFEAERSTTQMWIAYHHAVSLIPDCQRFPVCIALVVDCVIIIIVTIHVSHACPSKVLPRANLTHLFTSM